MLARKRKLVQALGLFDWMLEQALASEHTFLALLKVRALHGTSFRVACVGPRLAVNAAVTSADDTVRAPQVCGAVHAPQEAVLRLMRLLDSGVSGGPGCVAGLMKLLDDEGVRAGPRSAPAATPLSSSPVFSVQPRLHSRQSLLRSIHCCPKLWLRVSGLPVC